MKFCFFLVCLILFKIGYTQTPADSVKMVVNSLFAAMKTSDSVLLTKSFADSAILQTITKNKDGKIAIRNEAVHHFASQIGKLAKGDADERITFDVVKVDVDIAIV